MPARIPATRIRQIRRAVEIRENTQGAPEEMAGRIAGKTGLSEAEAREIIERKDKVFALRFGFKERAGQIEEEGFKRGNRYEERRLGPVNKAFDEVIPDHIRALGISRKNAYFFWPGNLWAINRYESHPKGDLRATRARINTKKAIVADMHDVELALRLQKCGAEIEKVAVDYWRKAIRLDEFLKKYYPKEGAWWLKDKADMKKGLPLIFLMPEILTSEEPGKTRASKTTYRLARDD
ncbi:MAG: hypothetical protein NT067_04965 [Candidatus Diapherotrites archaeon]|nr:hypothetical protein [Candidatus Diapherotrites archaeon]